MRTAVLHPNQLIYFVLAIAALSTRWSYSQSQASDLTAARRYYLDDLIKPHFYAPGKNSFLFQKLHRGDRRTLLELRGGGSVRHIWSTWSIPGDDSDTPAPRRVLVRVFVNGESRPSLAGPLDELCKAAEATGTRFTPLPAFNYKGAFNFYLPIFFEHGIRIEMEAADEIEELYAQIDYRNHGCREARPRLVGEQNGDELTLGYVGGAFSWRAHESPNMDVIERSATLTYGGKPAEISVQGPGIIRRLNFRGDALEDLELQIYWDDDLTPAVQAPLQYFFADFNNVAMESGPGQSTCYFPMPFRGKGRIVVRSFSGKHGRVAIEYSLDPHALPPRTLYFHAQYHESQKTLGYEQYSVLQTRGEGLFVGMNLFDSGHNHGGGDAALIDAGTKKPRVLHGICGEDYFGFAWHRTGTMTLLTGAPVHERRYRLHLENPYPFRESIQILFGAFAGQHPKSVAFWYQLPEAAFESSWRTFDVPWKILGPVGMDTSLLDTVSDEVYQTVVALNEPTKLSERWQDAEMRSGFLDATYQFRHYAMVERGTGFVAGASKTRLVTYAYAPSVRTVRTMLGHDDRVSLRVNHNQVVNTPARPGFGGDALSLSLHRGWNKLQMTVYNDENVTWRWCGISLAFDRKQSRDLRFASNPPTTQNEK